MSKGLESLPGRSTGRIARPIKLQISVIVLVCEHNHIFHARTEESLDTGANFKKLGRDPNHYCDLHLPPRAVSGRFDAARNDSQSPRACWYSFSRRDSDGSQEPE